MELRHLRYFIAVAEDLGFRKAAARLGISQPPLSLKIRELETELGAKLFRRNSRHVEITPSGRLLLEEARSILSRTDSLVRRLQQAGRGELGSLSVGFFPGADLTISFTEIIRAFSKRHPAVDLEMHQLSSREQVRALVERRIDIGFVRPPVEDPQLATDVVLREPLVVALPVRHRCASRSIVPLKLLAAERYVAPSRDRAGSFMDVIINYARSAGVVLNVVHEVEYAQILLSFVAADMGIAIVPKSFSTNERPGVIYRQLQPRPPHLTLLAAWRKEDDQPLIREFRAVVANVRKRGLK